MTTARINRTATDGALAGLVTLTALMACGSEPPAEGTLQPTIQPLACGGELIEDGRAYAGDTLGVLHMEIATDDLMGLAAVNNAADGVEIAVVMREGTFGAGAVAPNAKLSVRGRSTRLALQKSFKVKLLSKTDLWRGQRELNLNKHPFDLTRLRNKLSFDYFRAIPNFASLRTQFVSSFR